jgi:hypothetical protein
MAVADGGTVSANPALAPRARRCRACELVATIEDLAYRLFDPELNPLPLKGAVEYLATVGLTGTSRQLQAIALRHRRHIEQWIERGAAIAPAQSMDGVTRIPPPIGDARWVDVNQGGMTVGMTALGQIAARLSSGTMDDKDVIAVAKLGQNAAATRAALELKGSIKRAESIARLASGLATPEGV